MYLFGEHRKSELLLSFDDILVCHRKPQHLVGDCPHQRVVHVDDKVGVGFCWLTLADVKQGAMLEFQTLSLKLGIEFRRHLFTPNASLSISTLTNNFF